jgi:diguanylate cyclase (GGDEF)-like protein
MTNAPDLLQRYIGLQKAVLASLRLKDVLDAVIMQFYSLSSGSKVAIFLSDNDSLALKLMAARGYSNATLDLMKVVPFSTEGLLKHVVQQRTPISMDSQNISPDMSGSIIKREGSVVQLALPLIAANLLVGAVLIDSTDPNIIQQTQFLNATADLCALSIANSILYGRSEYERERINTLYKTASAFGSSALRTSEILQISADTALVLANTPNCAVLLYNPEIDSFELGAFKGLDAATLNQFDLSSRETIAGTTLRSAKTAIFGDGTRHPFGLPPAADGVPFSSAVVIPLIYENNPLGVIEVFSTEHDAFHREQIDLLESLSAQVSNALYISLTHESTASRAMEDAHTGLYSRPHFEQNLVKECERSARHHHEMGILMIDIDHLGRVNTTFGEDRGDEAIRYVAAVTKDTLRDMDVICRYGGQQFAVILPETPQQAVGEVGERLRANIRAKNAPGVGVVTVSIGASTFPSNGEHPPQLLEAAQQALDVAKYQGRDRVVMAQSGKNAKAGPVPWGELAKQAKFAVINERQAQLQSRLTAAPEYATWMTKNPSLVKKKSTNT